MSALPKDRIEELIAYLRSLGLSDDEIAAKLREYGVTQEEVQTTIGQPPRKADIFGAKPDATEREAIVDELASAGVRPEDYDGLKDVVTPSEFQAALTKQYAARPELPRLGTRETIAAARELGLSGREAAILLGEAEPTEDEKRAIEEKLGVSLDELRGGGGLQKLGEAAKRSGLSGREFEALAQEATSEPSEDTGPLTELGHGFLRGLLGTIKAGAKGLAGITGAKKLHEAAGELERAEIAAQEVLSPSKQPSAIGEIASATGELAGNVAPGLAAAALAGAAGGSSALQAGAFGIASLLPNIGEAMDTFEEKFGTEKPGAAVLAGVLMSALDTAAFETGVGKLIGTKEGAEIAKKIAEVASKEENGWIARAVVEGLFRLTERQAKSAAVEATQEVAQDLIAKATAAISTGDWERFKDRLLEEAQDTFSKVAVGTFFGGIPAGAASVTNSVVTVGRRSVESPTPEDDERAAYDRITGILRELDEGVVESEPVAPEGPAGPSVSPGGQQPELPQPPQPLPSGSAALPLPAGEQAQTEQRTKEVSQDELKRLREASRLLEEGNEKDAFELASLPLDPESPPPEDGIGEERAAKILGAVSDEAKPIELADLGASAPQAEGEQASDVFPTREELHDLLRLSKTHSYKVGERASWVADWAAKKYPAVSKYKTRLYSWALSTLTELTDFPLPWEAYRPGRYGPVVKASAFAPISSVLGPGRAEAALGAVGEAQPGGAGVFLDRPKPAPEPGHRVVVITMRTIGEAHAMARKMVEEAATVELGWVSVVGDTVVASVAPKRAIRFVAVASRTGSLDRRIVATETSASIITGGYGTGIGNTTEEAVKSAKYVRPRVVMTVSAPELATPEVKQKLAEIGLKPHHVTYAYGQLSYALNRPIKLKLAIDELTDEEKKVAAVLNEHMGVIWVPFAEKIPGLGALAVNMQMDGAKGTSEVIATFATSQALPYILAHEVGHSVWRRLPDADRIRYARSIRRALPELEDLLSKYYQQEEIDEEAFAEAFGYAFTFGDAEMKRKLVASAPTKVTAAMVDALFDHLTGSAKAVRRTKRAKSEPSLAGAPEILSTIRTTLANVFADAFSDLEAPGPLGPRDLIEMEAVPVAMRARAGTAEATEAFSGEFSGEDVLRRFGPEVASSVEPEARKQNLAPADPKDLARVRAQLTRISKTDPSPEIRVGASLAASVLEAFPYLSRRGRNMVPLGLPPTIRTPRDFAGVVWGVYRLAQAGMEVGGHRWYHGAVSKFHESVVGRPPANALETLRAAAALALFSPRARITSNAGAAAAVVTAAIRGDLDVSDVLAAIKNHSIAVFDSNVERVVRLFSESDEDGILKYFAGLWDGRSVRGDGRKVQAFFNALVAGEEGSPWAPQGEIGGSRFVADAWVGHGIGLSGEGVSGSRAYDLAQAVTAAVAEKLGVRIDEAQAAFWVAARASANLSRAVEAGAITEEEEKAVSKWSVAIVSGDHAVEAARAISKILAAFPTVDSYAQAVAPIFATVKATFAASSVDPHVVRGTIASEVGRIFGEAVGQAVDVKAGTDRVVVTAPFPVSPEDIEAMVAAVQRAAEAVGAGTVLAVDLGTSSVFPVSDPVGAETEQVAKKRLKLGQVPSIVVDDGDVAVTEAERAIGVEVVRNLGADLGPDTSQLVHVISRGGGSYVVALSLDPSDTAVALKAFMAAAKAAKEVFREASWRVGSVARVDVQRLGRDSEGQTAEGSREAGPSVSPRLTIKQRKGATEEREPTVEDITEMFRQAAESVEKTAGLREDEAERFAKYNTFLRAVRAQVSDRMAPAFDALKAVLGPDKARKLLDDVRFSTGPAEAIFARMREIAKDLARAGIGMDIVGAWYTLRRIAHEEYHWDDQAGTWVHGPGPGARGRATVENPLGITKERATAMLRELERRLGPEKVLQLEAATERVLQIYDRVVETAAQSGGWSEQAISFMRANRFYVAFAAVHEVPDPLAEQPGASVTGGVERQEGTTLPIINPFAATAMKLALLHMAAVKRKAISETIDALLALGLAREAPEEGRAGTPEVAALWRFEGTRKVRYWVPSSVAEAFNQISAFGYNIGKALQAVNGFFRGAWVTYSPRFVAFNPFRDVRQTLILLSQVKTPLDVARFLREWFATYREASRARKSGEYSPAVLEALEVGAIGGGYIGTFDYEVMTGDLAAAVYDLVSDPDRPWIEDVPVIGRAAAFLRAVGELQEQATKAGALRYLRKKGVPMEKAVDLVRNVVGTPNYRRSGRLASLIQFLLPFANVRKEGYRALILAAKEDPAAVAVKLAVFGVIPAAIKWSLRTGLALALYSAFRGDDDDDELEAIKMATAVMARATPSDYRNYTIIPIGLDEDDRAVYLRIPLDPATQIVSSLTIAALDGAFQQRGSTVPWDFVADGVAYAAQEIPSANPAIQFVSDMTMVALGFNPPDFWRGTTKVPRSIFEARDHRSFAIVAVNDLAQMLGPFGAPISRLPSVTRGRDTVLEAMRKNPNLNPFVGWFYRRSDAGLRATVEETIERKRVERARERLKLDDLLDEAADRKLPYSWVVREADRQGLLPKGSGLAARKRAVRDLRSRYLEKMGVTVKRNYRHLTKEELEALAEALDAIGETIK